MVAAVAAATVVAGAAAADATKHIDNQKYNQRGRKPSLVVLLSLEFLFMFSEKLAPCS